MEQLLAFHGDKAIKAKYLRRVRAHAKADRAVTTVIEWFERQGWGVNNRKSICANGADITVCKDNVALTVEIKLAFLTKRTWRVNRVSPPRRSDDLIAIVLPKHKKLLVQPMKEHLRLCGKDGTRSLNAVVAMNEVGL